MEILNVLSFRKARRFAVAAVLTGAMAVGAQVPAFANPANPAPDAGSSDFAWGVHTSTWGSSEGLPIPIRDGVRGLADGLANIISPGVTQRHTQLAPPPPPPPPAPAPAPGAPVHELPANFDPSKCPPSAKACIDLDNELTWLQEGGRITYGPVRESAGAPSPATATPKGSHRVVHKVKDEISRIHNNAPMPYSVYFTHNGVAFHAGSLDLWSHGCVHLTHADAKHYFETLNVGDEVYVY